MIKYYCDWCNAEIEDDGFISDRLVEMVAMQCITRIAELRENIKRMKIV